MDVSVIIPTYNREKSLSTLLDSLLLQVPVPFRWEVIIVDNNSNDKKFLTVNEKIKNSSINIRYIREYKPGLHEARHRGAFEALGDILGYLDDDTILSPTWLSGSELIRIGKADAISCRILPKCEVPPPEWFLQLFSTSCNGPLTLLDLGNERHPVDPLMVWGAGFFIRRDLVFKLKGFHPDGMPDDLLRYRGDGEGGLMCKLRNAGYRAWYDPISIVYHVIPQQKLTIEYLCKRLYKEGISNSFTDFRRQNGMGEDFGVPEIPGGFLRKSRAWLGRTKLGRLVKLLKRRIQIYHSANKEMVAIQKSIDLAWMKGWKYHREEVKKDSQLLAHVLRSQYL